MNARRTTRYAAVFAAGMLCLVQAVPASAGSPPHYPPGWHHSRHDRHIHAGHRYVVVDRLPHGCRHVYYRGQPYYYRSADWYRPYGVRFVVVAPPANLIIDDHGITVAAQVPLVRW